LDGPLGFYLRYKYYKLKCLNLGKNVKFGVGVLLRNPQYVSIGDNTCIDDYAIIIAGYNKNDKRRRRFLKNKNYSGEYGYVTIGRNCHISPNVFVLGIGGLFIGDDSVLGINSAIYTFTNMFNDFEYKSKIIYMSNMSSFENQYMVIGPVVIEENCDILYSSFVSPGVTIRKNCVALAYSKIVYNLKENSIYEGNPASFKCKRFK
jgi:putative colanic acid biosynthesis acetyltransferase WcaF